MARKPSAGAVGNATVDIKALLASYNEANQERENALAAVDAATTKRSQAVEAIVAAKGKGPYMFNGQTVMATSRESKEDNPDGTKRVTGITWYFKKIGDTVQNLDE